MKSLIVLLVFTTAIYTVHSLCNTCSSITNLACVDKNKFKVCAQGLPQPPAIQCPNGTVCTPNAQVCSPEGTVAPSCDMCKKCNEAKTFACTGYNTFALCLGTGVPNNMTNYMCADDLVCNIDSINICIDRKIAGIGSTCPWSTMITTTVAPPTTPSTTSTVNPITKPQEFCESKAERGRYDVDTDLTCTQYINCYQSNGIWYGNTYYCPSGTYFNASTQICGATKPARCASSGMDDICD